MQVKEDRRVVRFRFDCELSRKSMRDDHCGAAMISAKPVSYQSIIKLPVWVESTSYQPPLCGACAARL